MRGRTPANTLNDGLIHFFLISEVLRLFQKMTCVLSSEHESQIVTIIGTFLHDLHVDCK